MEIKVRAYGCHSTRRRAGYMAPDRKWLRDVEFVVGLTWIEDKASTDCRYDRRQDDERCKGCSK